MNIEAFYSINAESRLFWPYIVSSFFLAVLFVKIIKPSKKIKILHLFSKKYWLNSSLLIDFKILVFNKFLKIFVILPFEGILIFKFTKLSFTFLKVEPLFTDTSYSLLLMSFIYLFVDDAFKFLQHYMMHKIPFLWNFHRVHHSASTLNPFTLYRLHPVELFLASMRRILVTLILSLSVMFVFGEFLTFPKIMGVHGFYFLFNLIGGNLRHSHLPVSFSFLEHIFISPAQHQIHHSKDPEDFNKNFGVCFSFWDKICGSFKRSEIDRNLKFGLSYSDRKDLNSNFEFLLLSPFFSFLKNLRFIILKNFISKCILKDSFTRKGAIK